MATPFETEDTILTQVPADHINERHVYINEHPRALKFWLTFHLSSTSADLSQRAWEEDDEDVQLLESGWKEGHGNSCTCLLSTRRLAGTLKVFPQNISQYITPKSRG